MRYVVTFFIIFLSFFSTAATIWSQEFYYDYRDAGGDWEARIDGNRIALVADGRGQMGYFDIEIPVDGYYKIYAFVMHQWYSAWPMIETRIIQNNSIIQEGAFTVEPGELSHQEKGRWLVKSMDRGEMTYLEKGVTRVEFRLNSQKSIRVQGEGEIEGEVYLGSILVVPGDVDIGVMNVLEAERCTGDWDRIEYRVEDRCGIIESVDTSYAQLKVTIPQAGEYQLAALLRNAEETVLRVAVSRNKEQFNDSLLITLGRDDFWKMQSLGTQYFKKGIYYVHIQNTKANRLWIDSFILVPYYSMVHENAFALSCSTVFFYHNQGAANLPQGIKRILKAGFNSVDIVAYDGKYGFADDVSEEDVIQIQELVKKLKGRVASVHFGYIPLRSDEQAVERIRWALWIAGLVGAQRIVAPVSLDIDGKTFLSKNEGRKRLSLVMNQATPMLEQSGIELGFENHAGRQWLFQGTDDFLSSRELLSKKVTFVLDEAHFSLFGENPEDSFKQLLPYSRYVHLKSTRKDYIGRLKKLFKESNYRGSISLEVEKGTIGLTQLLEMYR